MFELGLVRTFGACGGPGDRGDRKFEPTRRGTSSCRCPELRVELGAPRRLDGSPFEAGARLSNGCSDSTQRKSRAQAHKTPSLTTPPEDLVVDVESSGRI